MDTILDPRRGLTASATRAYIGVSKREFAAKWQPHLDVIRSGTRLIFDRHQVDALFQSRLQAQTSNTAPKDSARSRLDLAVTLRACRALGRRASEAANARESGK